MKAFWLLAAMLAIFLGHGAQVRQALRWHTTPFRPRGEQRVAKIMEVLHV